MGYKIPLGITDCPYRQRNIAIWRDYVTTDTTFAALARKYGISKSRPHQIIHQITQGVFRYIFEFAPPYISHENLLAIREIIDGIQIKEDHNNQKFIGGRELFDRVPEKFIDRGNGFYDRQRGKPARLGQWVGTNDTD